MKGADEYYNLFGESRQVGRLYLLLHTHARGKCFEIFLLPEGVLVSENPRNQWRKDAVEVYGMTSGQRGWTESYGWLHTGKWTDDFMALVEVERAAKVVAAEKHEESVRLNEVKSHDRLQERLMDY